MLTLILAAGQGKRMNSDQPKVLQQLAGKPMISHLLDKLAKLDTRQALIYGHQGDLLKKALAEDYPKLMWIEQREQMGTGHAVQQALPQVRSDELVLILYGDTPMISLNTISAIMETAEKNDLTLLSAMVDNPKGYGRVVRASNGKVIAIVEDKDADESVLLVKEIMTGIMVARGSLLQELLPLLSNDNLQKEFYLTELVALAVKNQWQVEALISEKPWEVQGVNDRMQLAELEADIRERRALALMEQGVSLQDPKRVDILGHLTVGRDVYIEPNVIFRGDVVLGNGVYIESNCVLSDCSIGAGSRILSHSRVEGVIMGEHCAVGPFARIRPNCVVADRVKIGNFVELKEVVIGDGSKINHLSYMGDSTVGKNVNIGAGTITCNYDGANKFNTNIGDDVFIGSNSALVAPLTIGDGATVGAGSVIRKDVKYQVLALTVGEYRERSSWPRPVKKDK